MVTFYQEVPSLEIVHRKPNMVCFNVGDLDSPLGHGAHPQYLVFFDREVELDQNLGTLDHFAFDIPLEQFEAEKERLEQLELLERV